MREPGAAIVAAQVLAFYRDPVRHRPRLTHGREPFHGGLHVFRFAQGRFPERLVRDLSREERDNLRIAAVAFVRQVCLWDDASHHQVLCVPPGARLEDIKEHYHGLMALIHPDRQEASAEHWPADSAQRANQAYAVLTDADARMEYDATLRMAAAEAEESGMRISGAALPELARHSPTGPKVAMARMRKPVLAVGAALAALFFAQVWWAAEVPREYGVLSAATPFDLSTRWMRDALSNVERPKFLRSDTARAAKASAAHPAGPATAPKPKVQPLEPRAAPVRAEPAPVEAPAAAPAANPMPAAVPRAEPPARRIALSPPTAVALGPAATPSTASLAAMESLLARLLSYYEAGDLDRLMALHDASSLSVWQAMKLRYDFESFFRNTRSRRLRLNGVSLEASGETARARGKATLVAEYFDGPETRTERVVDIELDALLRDGQARISRLALFPHP